MYVIGRNDFDFIKIKRSDTLYDGEKIWCEIKDVEYENSLDKATIFTDYDKTKELVKEIQDNVENIRFANSSVIGEILDKEHSFDKIKYSKELKIYELIPTVVDK